MTDSHKLSSLQFLSDLKHQRIFNFYPGPSTLPVEVLSQIEKDLYNWKNLGLNSMEIGHRETDFIEFYHQLIAKIKKLMHINDNYEILLTHGGATAQYSAIVLNLLKKKAKAAYINCGHWAKKSFDEANLLRPNQVRIVASASDYAMKKLPEYDSWQFDDNDSYIYFTCNETIGGLAYLKDPNCHLSLSQVQKHPPLIADFTSNILTQNIDINRYGLIFASAQKCLGIAGLTLVVIRKDLLEKSKPNIPLILNYQKIAKNDSMLNTPATFNWYVMDLILDWTIKQGGILAMNKLNCEKSALIYNYIDKTDFYTNSIDPKYRSIVNICFNLVNQDLEALFVKLASQVGLIGLKGHRALGGIRASMYNAMPVCAAYNLVEFMQEFEKKYG